MIEISNLNNQNHSVANRHLLSPEIRLDACIEFAQHLLLISTFEGAFENIYATFINGEVSNFFEDKGNCSIEYRYLNIGGNQIASAALIPKNSLDARRSHIIHIIYESGRLQELNATFIPYLEMKVLTLQSIWPSHGMLVQKILRTAFGEEHPFLHAVKELKLAIPWNEINSISPDCGIFLQGHLDVICNNCIEGWVWNPADPQSKFIVEILCGDEVLTEGIADFYREDLTANGIGDGCFGFNLQLPMSLRDGNERLLTARVKHLQFPLNGTLSYQSNEMYKRYCDFIPHRTIRKLASEIAMQSIAQTPSLHMENFAFEAQQANLKIEQGHIDMAVNQLMLLLKVHRDAAFLMCLLGQCYLFLGKIVKAKDMYFSASLANADFFLAQLGLANCYAALGQWQEAEKRLSNALQFHPESSILRRRHADVLKRLQIEEARAALDNGHIDDCIDISKHLFFKENDDTEVRELLLQSLRIKEKAPDEIRLPLINEYASIDDDLILFNFILDEVGASYV